LNTYNSFNTAIFPELLSSLPRNLFLG